MKLFLKPLGQLGRLLLLSALWSATAAGQSASLQQADAYFQARQWDAAERVYREILQQDSTVAMAWYRLGRISLEGRSDARRAAERFEAALRHRFMPPLIARFGMARAYAVLGRKDDALAQLDTISATHGDPASVTGDSVFSSLSSDARYQAIVDRLKYNAQPCEYMQEARQFDFWLGTWDVFAPTGGQQLGVNRIEKTLRGCALVENWTGGLGREGKSINFFEPQRKTWRQVWVSDNGSVLDYREGAFRDGAMHFSGTTTNPRGDTILQKLTFQHVHQDTVRQLFEASTDGGKSWTTTWVGVYVRRK